MSHTVNNKTAIKCKFSNELHKLIDPAYGVKRSDRWMSKYKKEYTDKEKIELFDQIKKLHDEISEEYSNCLYKNRMRKKVKKMREAGKKVAQ